MSVSDIKDDVTWSRLLRYADYFQMYGLSLRTQNPYHRLRPYHEAMSPQWRDRLLGDPLRMEELAACEDPIVLRACLHAHTQLVLSNPHWALSWLEHPLFAAISLVYQREIVIEELAKKGCKWKDGSLISSAYIHSAPQYAINESPDPWLDWTQRRMKRAQIAAERCGLPLRDPASLLGAEEKVGMTRSGGRAWVGGIRSKREIIADPEATAEEIRTLERRDAVMHPNCPEDLWWKLAGKYPIEAQESILYPLFTVESPERWHELERENVAGWLWSHYQQLSKQVQVPFFLDCAAHVLPLFEKQFPKEIRPRQALELATAYLQGSATKKRLSAAVTAVYACRVPSTPHQYMAVVRAVCSATRNALGKEAGLTYDEAALAVGYAAVYAAKVPYDPSPHSAYFSTYHNAATAERLWQWRKLREYLRPSPKNDSAKVGARHSHEAFMSDPLASPDEIRRLSTAEPALAILHPNCPNDLWWRLAETYPTQAIQSPAYQLFLLEEPDRWLALEMEHAARWVEVCRHWLGTNSAMRRFAADCAAHVLHFWTASYPQDKRPAKAIQAARKYAAGRLSEEDLLLVWQQADGAAHAAREPALSAGRSAMHAADSNPAKLLNAIRAAGNAAYYAEGPAGGPSGADTEEEREQVWQWHRLLWYLAQAAPAK